MTLLLVHRASPDGLPRTTHLRIGATSAAVCSLLTHALHCRGSGGFLGLANHLYSSLDWRLAHADPHRHGLDTSADFALQVNGSDIFVEKHNSVTLTGSDVLLIPFLLIARARSTYSPGPTFLRRKLNGFLAARHVLGRGR